MRITDSKHFRAVLIVLRRKRGFSLTRLADRSGVDVSDIHRIESSPNARISLNVAIKLVRGLDLSLDLFDWGGELTFTDDERELFRHPELLVKWSRTMPKIPPELLKVKVEGVDPLGYRLSLKEFLKANLPRKDPPPGKK